MRTSEVFCHENEKKEKVVIRDQNLSYFRSSNTERENVVVRTVATVLFEPSSTLGVRTYYSTRLRSTVYSIVRPAFG